MADTAVEGEDRPLTIARDEDDDKSAAAIFASMVPPASVMGAIEAKIHMETTALDAFIVQLLEGLRKLASVSSRKHIIYHHVACLDAVAIFVVYVSKTNAPSRPRRT